MRLFYQRAAFFPRCVPGPAPGPQWLDDGADEKESCRCSAAPLREFQALGKRTESIAVCVCVCVADPDPPILAFFDFLAFFVFRFSLLFCAFFLPFPGILGVPRGGKPLLFWGKTLAFSKKARVGGSGENHCIHEFGVTLTLQPLLFWKKQGFPLKKQGFFSSRNP